MHFSRKRATALAVTTAAAALLAACGGNADEAGVAEPAVAERSDSEDSTRGATPAAEPSPTLAPAIPESSRPAPELVNVSGWINSEPFSLKEQRGKVVLVDFWTYTCVNCIRTMPYLRAWHEKYADKGLLILGVHTPEFAFEEVRENVIDATETFALEYPVIQDNDSGTWNAFDNRFWPAKYLIDKDGFIRYEHFGEGSYSETETWIRDMLEEAGADLRDIPADTSPEPEVDRSARSASNDMALTRELYGGYARNYGALQSQTVPPYILHREYYETLDSEVMYSDPGEHQNHFLYLEGLWRNEAESIVHARETEDFEDYLGINFYATSVNAVMSSGSEEPYRVRATLDGAPLTMEDAGTDVTYDADGNSYIVVDEPRMYSLVNLSTFGGHELELSSNSPDFALFAYTFGAYKDGEPVSPQGS